MEEIEETQEIQKLEEIEENIEPIRTKSMRKLILLVSFTAIMLITSTYAWFSTQKNVTISGLEGVVNVAEGLQISLDALNWTNEIDLSTEGVIKYFKATNDALGTNYNLTNPYSGRTNIIPTDMLPVSTTAQEDEGIGLQRLNMYSGVNTDGILLSKIKLLNEEADSGYYAIDLFLQNTSSTTAVANNIQDLIKLDTNSAVVVNAGKGTTGLQNTLRVAFALFDNAGGEAKDVLVSELPSQSQIIGATASQNIIDVAIWEPNAYGEKITETVGEGASAVTTVKTYPAHVDYIVQNNNSIKWSIADASAYFNQTITEPKVINYTSGTRIPTYALTGTSETAENIANIYDWATPSAGLEKQVTLQTPNTGVGNNPIQLKSVTGSDFAIAPGEYHKVRMYVWLEGQDVDCINYASLGGGLTIDIGLRKGDGGSVEEDENLVAGLYDADGVMLCTWEESGIDATGWFGDSPYNGGYFETSETSGYYVLTNYYPTTTKIVLPDSITEIGERVFYKCSNLTSIVVPESVSVIGEEAFSYCTNLASFIIPDNITCIDHGLFYRCNGLTSIVIPEGVIEIGMSAFSCCENLESVSIPDSVSSIGGNAFNQCANLVSVAIPEGIARIENDTFKNCENLTYIKIPNSVTSIGDYAFSGCVNLASITIPNSVTSMGEHAFYECSALTSVTLSSNITSIEGYTFYFCENLNTILIPDNVKNIGNRAFYGCSSLNSVTYNGTTYTGSRGNWAELKIALTSNEVSVGYYAFD